MYLIYKTDANHSYASRDLIACTNKNELACIKLCEEQAKKEGYELDEDQFYNLAQLQQTQGYAGEGEFQYEFMKQDVLL